MIFAAGAGAGAGAGRPSASRMNFSLVFDTFGVDQSSSEISHYDSSTKLLNATFTNYQNLIIDVDGEKYLSIKVWTIWLGAAIPSSVGSSAPTILRSWVRIPPSTLSKSNFVLC